MACAFGSAVRDLAGTLASMSPAPLGMVQRLLAMCPPATAPFLGHRHQEAVLALARFVVDSGGQHAAEVVPYLIGFTKGLPQMKRTVGIATTDPRSFNTALFSAMGEVAAVTDDFRAEVLETLLSLADSVGNTTLSSLKERAGAVGAAGSSPGASTLCVPEPTELLVDLLRAMGTVSLLKTPAE